jgi:poly-gamma-glutamate synthesis protein (capsule biosynthesis protein)
MKIAIVGDWTYQNYEPLNEEILNIFNQSNYVLYNFEAAIDFGGQKVEKSYNFSVKQDQEFYLNNKTICHLANNHLCDSGIEDAYNTIEYIRSKGKIIGVSSEKNEIRPYTIIKLKSEKVGIVGCCEWKQNNNLFSFLQFDSIEFWRIIKKLRERVDRLIVSVHWGMEQVFIPTPQQQNIARKAIENGIDFIVGHHSHVFQPYEKYLNRYIFYSIGNFQIPITNDYFKDRQRISNILIMNTKDNSINFNPILICNSQPTLIINKEILRFYEKFDDKFINIKNNFLNSLACHYKQNWDSWKKRFRLYGIKEYYNYIRFILKRNNFLGMLLYIYLHIIMKTEFNPIKKFRVC